MKDERKQDRTDVVTYLEVRESGTNREVGRVSEITTEGMKLQSPEPMDTDTTLSFEMVLPPHRRTREAIKFEAQVIWCKKSDTPGMYESGIRMEHVSPADVEVIQQIMEESPFGIARLSVNRTRPLEH